MSKNYKIAFAVPGKLKNELNEKIIKDGYGFRGKSKWVSEAVGNLLQVKNFPDLVNYSDEMSGFDAMETSLIDYQLKLKLDNAILQIRKEFPTLEGVTSRIMRTAILQRLLRS
ncbi:MAG: hypothetical protein A3F13_00765 [Gammaproteobacteria bacterium RIFCSPHIGHO2_12_FULL_40_19]|nr:MAG: hypothetical protein A3F13_00765 [Gammaproteobacteria bacterium RIFCSPHIGHO2_12_FULL_40_19]